MLSTVERIARPSRRDFERDYLLAGKPVIITDVVSHWKAYSLWSREYMCNALKSTRLQVSMSELGRANNSKTFDTSAEAFFLQARKSDPAPYITMRMPTALLNDVEAPPYFSAGDAVYPAFWCGSASISALHYHPHGEALLCVVTGEKRVVLFSPEQSHLLYPWPFYRRDFNASRILDPEKGCQKEFPRFTQAHSIECTVKAGEMLFIPVHWWHAVYGSPEMSMAVTFFWRALFKKMLLPPSGRAHHWASLLARRQFIAVSDVLAWALRRGPVIEATERA